MGTTCEGRVGVGESREVAPGQVPAEVFDPQKLPGGDALGAWTGGCRPSTAGRAGVPEPLTEAPPGLTDTGAGERRGKAGRKGPRLEDGTARAKNKALEIRSPGSGSASHRPVRPLASVLISLGSICLICVSG